MRTNPVLNRFKVPESNVFLMTRFRETEYHSEISRAVSDAVRAFGLNFVRADDPNWSALTLWDRVRSCLDACWLGVAIFETIDEEDFNPNVSFELGYMLARDRDCLVLKEKRLKKLPADLCGHLYKEFDSRNITGTVVGQVADWLQEIGVRKRDGEKLIVFVSTGGTCRCAIAKAILGHLLGKTKPKFRYRLESRAMWEPSLGSATQAARTAVQKVTGADALEEHHPRRAGSGFLFEADLILAMDHGVLDGLLSAHCEYPGAEADRATVEQEIRSKSFLATEFFGSSGEVSDPYPDNGDNKSLKRYHDCAQFLSMLMSTGLDRLFEFLSRSAPNPAVKRTVAFGARRLSP